MDEHLPSHETGEQLNTQRAITKKIIFFIIGFFIFVISATAFFIYGPIIRKDANALLLNSFKNFLDENSYSTETDIHFFVSSRNRGKDWNFRNLSFLPEEKFKFLISSKHNVTKLPVRKAWGEIHFVFPSGVAFPVFGASGETVKFSYFFPDVENVYFRIEQFPQIPFFDVSELQKKWVHVYIPSAVEKYQLKRNDNIQSYEEFAKRAFEIYEEQKPLKDFSVRRTTYDGVAAYQLNSSIEADVINNFLKSIVLILVSDQNAAIQDNFIKKNLDHFFSDFIFDDLTIFVGKDSDIFRGMEISAEYSFDSNQREDTKSMKEQSDIDIEIIQKYTYQEEELPTDIDSQNTYSVEEYLSFWNKIFGSHENNNNSSKNLMER